MQNNKSSNNFQLLLIEIKLILLQGLSGSRNNTINKHVKKLKLSIKNILHPIKVSRLYLVNH